MRTEQKTKALLHTLLEKVKPFEKTYVHGRYLEPTVVRVTGKDVDDSKAPKTMRAIFINYPYFALDKIQETKTLKKGGAHPPRSLLQAHFRLSSTKDRDELQVVRNVTKGKDSRILYVPQVWSILLEHGKHLEPLTLRRMRRRLTHFLYRDDNHILLLKSRGAS